MSFLRNSVFKILYHSGIGKNLLNRNRKKNRVPVLVFHKIIPEYDQIWPGIHPQLFEKIIILLKKHYVILPLNALYLGDTPMVKLRNACFITFDDGYKDFLDYAYPIMLKLFLLYLFYPINSATEGIFGPLPSYFSLNIIRLKK